MTGVESGLKAGGGGRLWKVLECLGPFPLQPGHILPPVTFIALDGTFQTPSLSILEHREPLETNPDLPNTRGRGVTPQAATLAKGAEILIEGRAGATGLRWKLLESESHAEVVRPSSPHPHLRQDHCAHEA